MIKYNKLFSLLATRGYKKIDLVKLKIISGPTLTKLVKGENVQTSVIDKLCIFLKVQPSQIMEVFEYAIYDEKDIDEIPISEAENVSYVNVHYKKILTPEEEASLDEADKYFTCVEERTKRSSIIVET